MLEVKSTGPSVLGCAHGFGWAGMGVGQLVFMLALKVGIIPINGNDVERYVALLRGSFIAMGLGTVAGIWAGIVYARRRSHP